MLSARDSVRSHRTKVVSSCMQHSGGIPESSRTHFFADWDVASRHDQWDDYPRKGEGGNFGPKKPSFGSIRRDQGICRQWPEVTIRVDKPCCQQQQSYMSFQEVTSTVSGNCCE